MLTRVWAVGWSEAGVVKGIRSRHTSQACGAGSTWTKTFSIQE